MRERKPGHGEAAAAQEIHRFQSQRGRVRATGNGGADERTDARGVVPRGGVGEGQRSERHDPALAEIVGIRLLLVNVLGPVAAGEKVTAESFTV